MTVEDFKRDNHSLAHLEGDELYNAMEDSMLKQQVGDSVLLQTKPFYKRYQLRYLFYRRTPWHIPE